MAGRVAQNIDNDLLLSYCNAMLTRGVRGPVNLDKILHSFRETEGNPDKIKDYLFNVFSSLGVGCEEENNLCVPIYDMDELFHKDKVRYFGVEL